MIVLVAVFTVLLLFLIYVLMFMDRCCCRWLVAVVTGAVAAFVVGLAVAVVRP